MPLFGPIGGGLGLGASLPSGGAVVVAGAGAAASSAALTTSLELLLLFFEGKNTMLFLEAELAFPVTLGVSKNPEAADAMLQLAKSSLSDLSVSVTEGKKEVRQISLRKRKKKD